MIVCQQDLPWMLTGCPGQHTLAVVSCSCHRSGPCHMPPPASALSLGQGSPSSYTPTKGDMQPQPWLSGAGLVQQSVITHPTHTTSQSSQRCTAPPRRDCGPTKPAAAPQQPNKKAADWELDTKRGATKQRPCGGCCFTRPPPPRSPRPPPRRWRPGTAGTR
jgi:hypothetical protein